MNFDSFDNAQARAFLVLLECFGIWIICLCRLRNMHQYVLRRVVWEYAIYMGGTAFIALAPWKGFWPDWPLVVSLGIMLIGLLAGAHAWRDNSVPDEASGFTNLRKVDGSKA